MDWKRKVDNLEKANNQNEKLLKELKQKCEQQSLELEEARKRQEKARDILIKLKDSNALLKDGNKKLLEEMSSQIGRDNNTDEIKKLLENMMSQIERNNQNEKLLRELKQKCVQQSLELVEAKKVVIIF